MVEEHTSFRGRRRRRGMEASFFWRWHMNWWGEQDRPRSRSGIPKSPSLPNHPTALNPCWRLLKIHDSLANAPVASNPSCAHPHSQCCRRRPRRLGDGCSHSRRSLSQHARYTRGRRYTYALKVCSEPCLVQQLGSILSTRQRS